MASPIRLLVHGASGRMGRAVLRLGAADPRFEIVAAVSRSGATPPDCKAPGFAGDLLARCPDFEVAIDFSLPAALPPLLALCTARNAALVSGTTGLDPEMRACLHEAGRAIPVAWASNFSLGVIVLEDLLRRAAGALPWPVTISETHHVHKLDAPSGTAITLAAAAAQVQGSTPPIESVREGEVVGIHRLQLHGPGERLELGHVAEDRDIFARGALEVAARLRAHPAGLWRVGDLLFGGRNADQPAD